MAKRGRPSTYTHEIAAVICEGLASGQSLIAICKRPGMPNCSTVFVWLTKHPEFQEQYTRAREAQADYYAAEIAEIADTPREGLKEKRTQVGWQCPKCQRAAKWASSAWVHVDGTVICEGVQKPQPVYAVEVTSADMIEHRRLQVDARKWLMSKLAPKKYGDRLELAGELKTTISVAETLRRRREQRELGVCAPGTSVPAIGAGLSDAAEIGDSPREESTT